MNVINLDLIIRTAGGSSDLIPGEEKLVTIDLNSGKAIEKTILVRMAGGFQDYIVANNTNPLRTVSAKVMTYYVRDDHYSRSLAIDIAVIAVNCAPGKEVKVAESLHGEQAPGQIFAGLLERWVREFISAGEESDFIDNFDAARNHLEIHIANRASTQTGLDLTAKVTLSGESSLQREIVLGPIEIGVRLQGYTEEQKITVEAGLALDPQDYVKAFVFSERLDSPEELFKRKLKDYFFQNVSFKQFTHDLHYPAFKQPLLQALSRSLKQVGRTVRFINISTNSSGTHKAPREFVAVNYDHEQAIPGRAQPVVIQNTVQLYCEDSVAFLASRITDLERWVKDTLNVTLKRHLIGKSYVDLLLRFAAIEVEVKRDVSAAAALVGYRVDHLVSVPNLKEEENGLTNAFLLEAEDTFETSLDKFEVQLKFNIRLCIPKLDSIERYLNPGTDVKEAIKQTVLREARQWLRNIHPERFYLYFNQPNKAAAVSAGEDERLPVKELLTRKILESLKKEFNARIFDLNLRVGRSDLTERYNKLCFVIRDFSVQIESPDPQATENLMLTGNFELLGVHSDENGWRRFSRLQLDLEGLKHQLETHLKSELKTYYQSMFLYQNRLGRQQVFNLIKSCADQYMRQEFGLIVHLTNLDRNTTKVEEDHRQFLIEMETEKLRAETEQGKLLVGRLNDLRKTRLKELSVFPVDRKTLAQIDENIELLEEELKKLSLSRFGQHAVAGALADQMPDELPAIEDSQPTGQSKLRPAPKAQLAS